MKEIVFSREIKELINDIRSYGIQHCSESKMEILLEDSDKLNEFTIQVHKGFFIAQKSAIFLLKKLLKEQKINKINLKQARCNKNKEKIQSISKQIKTTRYREMVVRKAMDAIAWQLFQYDLTTMRRLYYGQELIDITDSNLDSELSYIDLYLKDYPNCFVLINDLTSFIQIGDVVTFVPGKGIQIGELKEGKTNLEMFQLINEFIKVKCPYYMKKELEKLDEKKREQFFRDIKQMDRSIKIQSTIQDGEGTDLLTGMPIKIDSNEEIILSTFNETVNSLLNKCSRKGYAISVIEGCLLVGVYDTRKFPGSAFNAWAKTLNIKMPIVDLRHAYRL